MSILLMIFEIIIIYIFVILSYKKNKYEGLYLYCILAYVLSIIISVKSIELYYIEIPLGIILTTSIYVVSNILVQNKGLESIKKLITMLFIVAICTISIILLTSLLTTSNVNSVLNTYSLMFINKIKIVMITAILPLIILWLNSNNYYQLKREKNNMIISHLLTIIIIYFIDTCIYTILSFTHVLLINELLKAIIIVYTIKLVVGISGIITLYKIKK